MAAQNSRSRRAGGLSHILAEEARFMKVIGIIASPKGKESNTLKLVNAALAGAAAEGAKTELVDLYKLRIEYLHRLRHLLCKRRMHPA